MRGVSLIAVSVCLPSSRMELLVNVSPPPLGHHLIYHISIIFPLLRRIFLCLLSSFYFFHPFSFIHLHCRTHKDAEKKKELFSLFNTNTFVLFCRSLDPCDLKQCGQNAECALTQDGAVCQCKPGCTGNANTGCEDINECTSLMPIDPNGPCGPSAICINLLGSYKCQCASDSSNGDPYTTGCTGVSKCTSDNRCPDDTFCDSQAGQCIDACSTTHCGPNAQCTSRGHKGSCQCKTGFLGDPNDQIHGCKSREYNNIHIFTQVDERKMSFKNIFLLI